MSSALDLSADQLELVYYETIRRADWKGWEAALGLLALKDPGRAERLLNTTKTVVAVARLVGDNQEDGDE